MERDCLIFGCGKKSGRASHDFHPKHAVYVVPLNPTQSREHPRHFHNFAGKPIFVIYDEHPRCEDLEKVENAG
jgi:hypothetical protein